MSDNPLKIINEIVAPDLTDERFSDSLNEAFALINDNFKKIVSAPIYRGQQGENTKIKEVAILDGNQFTDEGKKIVKVIFEDANLDEWDGSFESLKTILAGINKYKPIGSKSAVDYFTANDKILMFYLDNVEETLLAPAQLYIFQDERVGDITDTTEGFEDMTCFVSFEWDAENKTYTYVKAEQFPTIAWSTAMGDYVWKINGQLTNIIVKGLKGADAHFYIPMFKAFYSGNIWNAVAIYSGGGWQSLNPIYMDELQEGMTSIVYIIPDENGVDENTTPIGIEITTIQRFDKAANPPYVHLYYQGASIEAKTLDTMMDEIRPAMEASIRETIPAGLYIPADGVGNETVTNIHALWRTTDQSTCTEANFGYAKKNDIGIGINDGVTTLNIHNYQTINFKQNNEECGYMWINNDGGTKDFKMGNGNSHIIFRNNENESVNHIMFHTPGTELMIGNSIVLAYGSITGNVNINPLITNGIKIDGTGTTVIGGLQSKGDFSVDLNSITVFKISLDSNNYTSLGAKIKAININTDINFDNEINIGKSGKTTININGKNVNILESTGISAEANGAKLSLSGDGTGKISLISNNGLVEIKDATYNYTGIKFASSYGSEVYGNIFGYVLRYHTGSEIQLGNLNLMNWTTDGSFGWRTGVNAATWDEFQIYYQQYGRFAHLYGKIKTYINDKTNYMIDISKLSKLNGVYKRPITTGAVSDLWVIGGLMSNDGNGWGSSPIIYSDGNNQVPAAWYPNDDGDWKKHGWIYLSTTSDWIIFVTPKAGRHYWFDVWYFV